MKERCLIPRHMFPLGNIALLEAYADFDSAHEALWMARDGSISRRLVVEHV